MGRPLQQDSRANYEPTRWSLVKQSERGKAVVESVRYLKKEQSSRALRAKKNLETQLGRSIVDNGDGGLGYAVSSNEHNGIDSAHGVTLRVAQSVCDTAVAKIAAKQKPKAVFVTSGGNYSQRMKARNQTKFFEAQLRRPHGQYADAWELTEQVFADGLRWEAGVLRVVPDLSEARPVLQRHYATDIFFDPHDSRYGNPQNLFTEYPEDRLVLAAKYPEYKSQIMSAECFDFSKDIAVRSGGGDQVAVYEAIRLPMSADAPGRRMVCVATSKASSGVQVLVDEEWKRPGFPFLFYKWIPHAWGPWSNPLVEQIESIQEQTNNTYDFITEKVMSNSTTMIEYDPNVYSKSDLAANEAVTLIEKKGPEGSINIHQPAPFHPGMSSHLQFQYSNCFEGPGVSEMGATGRSELGMNASGKALRTQNAMSDQRFLPPSRRYENLFVGITERMLWCMQDLDSSDLVEKDKLKASLADGDSLEEFLWDDVKMERDTYEITLQPASSLTGTPGAKLALITEWTENQMISPEAGKRLIAQESPDVDAVTSRESSQYKYLDKIIAKVQRYAIDLENDPDTEPPKIGQPDPLLDLEGAVVHMTLGYREMLCQEAPEEAVRIIRDWITEATQEIQKRQAAMAPPPEAAPVDPMAEDPAMGQEMDPMADPMADPTMGMGPMF